MPAPDLLGFRILLPAKWVEIDLDPGSSAAALRAIVEERGGAARTAGATEEDLLGLLEGVAAAARATGASYAAFYSDVFGDRVISASLIAGMVSGAGAPPPREADPASAAAALRQLLAPDGDAEIRDLPAGRAVRVQRRQDVPAPGGQLIPVENVQWLIPTPGLEGVCLLEFNTPAVALAGSFSQLFDAIAGSLTWT